MKHLFVVFGPSGCGKSTMAEYVAKKKSYLFLEGDQVTNLQPELVLSSTDRSSTIPKLT
jgi:ABC-type sugar transport system ATPase subunit